MSRHAASYELEFVEPPPPLRSLHAPEQAKPRTPRKIVTPPDYVAPDSRRPHGTRVKYVIERCRCEPCRSANREASRARVNAMRRPDEAWVPYIPAGPARRHLETLMAQGMGPKSIAKVSGVPHGAISKIIYGDYKTGRKSKRIRPATARKLLAVSVTDARGGQKVDAAPTWQLLDELIAKGWPKAHLAELIVGPDAVALQISRRKVRASTARKVEQVYAAVKDAPVPSKRSRWSR